MDPDKIIVFGSYAYGEPHQDSDLDIIVIMPSSLPRHRRSVPIYRSLTGILIPKDILVYTPEEVEMWSQVPQAFITSVLREGKVMHEKNAG